MNPRPLHSSRNTRSRSLGLDRSAAQPPRCAAGLVVAGESGVGLAEVIAGTLVATLAVIGLAYSLGMGRGLVDRYLVARNAMSRAQLVVDSLITQPPASLVNGSQPLWVDGTVVGTTAWTITWVDDPVDGTAGSSPADPNPNDRKRITVEVTWQLGGMPEKLTLSRTVLGI